MIVNVTQSGPDITDEEGMLIKRGVSIYHFDTGTVIKVIPPDPYPSKEEQRGILDRLYAGMMFEK